MLRWKIVVGYFIADRSCSSINKGGRDDAKVSIPSTVVLRYMFAPAEMRVRLKFGTRYCPWFTLGFFATGNLVIKILLVVIL